jgi:hypothetical protein
LLRLYTIGVTVVADPVVAILSSPYFLCLLI